jgi:hypothetical protein
MALTIKVLFATFMHKLHSAQQHFAVMLHVIMLSVVMLNVFMLSVVTLTASLNDQSKNVYHAGP